MKQGQWMLNGSYGGRWESITYFDTKEEAIKHGINLLKKYNHNTHDEKTRNQVMNDLTIYSYYNELIYTFFVGEIEEIAFPDETDSLPSIRRNYKDSYTDGRNSVVIYLSAS
ncbi:hypothetical protein [Listeria seeligeri]|uniref:hypothetical protein n=1 Tax=Listeria seeligeri TaxID=1640 RepID=UPI0021AB2658|nr:hypothetical protein [Listeria seeligeri]